MAVRGGRRTPEAEGPTGSEGAEPRGSEREAAARARPGGEAGGALDQATFAAHARFRHALRGFLRFSEQAARAEGITPEQHQLLLALRGSPLGWLAVGEVARELMVVPHGAAGLVERAVAHGLVRKEPDPGDHRRVRVHLTEGGDALITRLTAAHQAELRRLWARIPPPR